MAEKCTLGLVSVMVLLVLLCCVPEGQTNNNSNRKGFTGLPNGDSREVDLSSYPSETLINNDERIRRQTRYYNSPGDEDTEEDDVVDRLLEASSIRLASSSLGAEFSRGYIDLGQRDPVEEGAVSLAFVFDITGSMNDDIVQVIDGAGRILSTVLEKFERPIHNFVFIPFHDPVVGPVTVTTDPREFQASLRRSQLDIHSGGDCPEMALLAIKQAVEVSLPSSYVYVFTDARAKDYHLLDEVLRIIERKQTQVVFVMTGDCGNHTHPGFQAFETIASTSSGQLFQLDKSDVKEVLSFVRVSLEARKVNLFSVDRESDGPGEENLPLLVDPTLKQFTISVSGQKPKIEIVGPEGETVGEPEGVENLLTLENVKIVGVKEPPPGRYNISVGSESKYTVRATGLSSLNFKHGFSLKPTINFKETYHHPMRGGTNYLLVQPVDATEFGELSRLQLLSLDGEVLEDLPLTRLEGPGHVYNASTFTAPDHPFNIKLFGHDEHGFQFERISPTAVSSELPSKPEVSAESHVSGHHGHRTVITCHVQTLVPFTLHWQRDGSDITRPQTYPQSAEVEYVVERAHSYDEGQYTCVATNIAGSTSANISLDVKEPPPHLYTRPSISLVPTRPAVLNCSVTSTVPYNLTWSRYVEQGKVQDFFGRMETIGKFVDVRELEGYRVLANNSLVLEEVTRDHKGWFRCTAMNEGGRVSREIEVGVVETPVVSVVPGRMPFRTGDNITLSCDVYGSPLPTLTWRRGNTILTEDGRGRIRVDRGGLYLHLHHARREDEGSYFCHASNSAGSAQSEGRLRYTEAPQVRATREDILVAIGDTAVLECHVTGIPPPDVHWLKDGTIDVTPLSFIQMDGPQLRITGVEETDAGQYTCMATNMVGTAQAEMYLRIGRPPTVVTAPSDTRVEIGASGLLVCYGSGEPQPTIHWYRDDGTPLPPHLVPDNDGNLRITAIQVEDEGGYTCVIENRYGRRELHASLILTGFLAPVIDGPPNLHVPALLGSHVALPCVVVEGRPTPQLAWLHRGQPITPDSGIVVRADGSLSIPAIRMRDEGEYQCVVTNLAGSSSRTLNLTILVPPRAKSGQAIEEVEVTEGALAKLKCPVRANPRPEFSWYKDGRPLSGDQRRVRVVRGGVVIIRQVEESDAGTYVCTATNLVGNTTIPVVLNVLVPPSIRRNTESYTVNNGEKLDIPCESSGRPQPSVSWARRQDRKLMWDNTLLDGTLRLVGSAEAEGEYDCVAVNDAGSAKRSVIVQLSKLPKISPTGHETLTVEAGQDIKLPCEVEGLPTPRVTWQKERHLITTSDDLRPEPGYLLLHGTQPDTAGQYICTATNIAGTATKAFTVHVNYAPIVTEEEQVWPEQSVVEGGQFTLPCPAHARPHPRRDWTKDGEQLVTEAGLSISTGGSVEVERATPVHGGHYRCTLTNTLGRAHINYDVRILVPPRVASQLDTSIPQVVEGDEVAINCPVDAVPIPTIKWFKDGVSILSTKDRADMTHIIIEENGQTLHILDATIDDQGLYRCVAWNDAGETEMTVPLEVLVPPQFTQFFHVPEVTLKLGQYLHLDCGVNGDPEPQVVWKHNGVVLTDDDIGIGGQHVIVASAGIRNAGFYTCVAKNAAGTASRNFTVTVLMAPTLEENEGESAGKRGLVAAVSGEDSHLRCGITGSPIPTLSWTKDELPLRQWSDLEYSITDDYQVLTLHQVDPHYSGLYLCSGANALGETQRQFNVSVLSPPSMGESGDEDVVEELSVVVGDDITLSCPVNGFPPPSITWLRGGRALVSAPPYRVHPAPHLLQLSGVTQEEAGDYTCLATNRAGAAEKQFDLRIIVPARIVAPGNERESAETQPQQEVMVDMPFSLYCPVTGSPTPHITWTKDDAPLVDLTGVGLSGQHVSVVDEGKRLLVAGASVRDSGNYTCTAANHAGSDSAVYQVSVLVPPLISVDETETLHSSVEGEKVVLECEVEGEPGPRVVWEQDGVALSDLQLPSVSIQDTLLTSNDEVTITKSEVHMESVGEQHAGTYTCLASSPAGSDQLSYIVRVATAPRLEEDWADGDDSSTNVITTHVNRPAVLSCRVHANPDPQIFWFKNTDPVDEMNSNMVISGDGRELRIIATDVDDAGNYTCLAVNEAGDIFLNFTLDVHVPPRLSGEVEEEVRVAVGDEATLVCPVYATPSPSILWMKDSDILPQSFISLEPQRLVVNNVSREDGGRYTCLATNEAGTLEQDFSLHVLVPPQLGDLEDPVIARAIVVNRPVTLSCLITADPPPSFTWLKDGEPLSSFTWTLDSTRRHLSLGRVKPEDAGNYTCVATNPAGTTTLTTTLSVLSPPTWDPESDYEEDVTGVAGGVTSLHCDVTALPPPSLLWLRDGHVISYDSPNINLTLNDKVLVLSDVEESDGGRYVCVASNAAGTVEYEFQLTVHAPPSLTYHPLYNHTVVVNRATTLDCPVEGTPDPEVKWLVGEREVMNSGKYVRLSPSGRQLHLLRVLESMGGPVVCSAVNPAGHLVTEYNLEVLVPPSLIPMPPMLRATVMEGDTLRLFCRAAGNPLPQVMWVVGEEQVLDAGEDEGGRMVHEGGQTLEVKTARAEHQGSYTCLATNTAGSAQETFTVQVLIPPMIEEPESGTRIDVAESANVVLSCPTLAQPHPEVTWFKNGEDLKSGRDPFLHVTGGGEQLRFLRVLASHAGNYTCLATNPAGQDALTYHLQVQVPPVIIEDSGENPLGETVGVVGGNIDLECYTLGSPMPSLTWTKDNQSIETGRRVSLEEVGQVLKVTDARVEDAGRYTCKAASSAGATSRDFVVVIHSPPRIVPPAEREVEAVAGRSLVLTCEAESSLTPARTWLRHGRPLSPFTNPNIQVRGGGQEMEIVRVRESDGGEYTCIVLSTAGQDLLMYTVVVQVPARIERANVRERVSGVAGKSLELVCEAAGSPPPTITWTHASTLITPDHPHYQILEDTRRLKIQEVEVGDEGIITCAAHNTAGKDSLNFTLNVLVAPHVPADGVTDIRVREGESVVLQCPVAATPAASVLWTRAGSVVGVSGRGNVDVGGDGRTLRVVRAGTHNAGDYTCTATNQAGVIDIPVTLNVLVPPVIARKKGGVMGGVGVGEEVVRVREGGHAALECHLMKGSPTPSRHWDAPHHPHHPPHHTVVGGGERLVIAGAGVGDSGAYSCRANNSAGEDVKVVWVEVMAPPRINTTALPGNPTVLIPGGAEFGGRGDSQVSTTLTTTPGTTVILPCPVTGSPPPRRLWYRGTEALVSTSRQVVGAGGRDLTLVGISGRDAGAYVCLAVNPAGEAQLTTALIIIGRPKIEGDSEEEVTVVEGGRAELECRVKRPPSTLGTRTSTVSPHRYNITWTKSGQELLRHPQSVPILSKQTLQGSRWEEEDFPTLSDSPTVHDVTHSENRTSLENRYEDINSFDNYSNVYDYTYEYPVSALTPPDQREGEQRRNNTGWYSISRDRTRLTLPRVTRTEEGLYSCEVTNQAGSTRRIFRVDALVSPVIEEVETARRRLAAAVGDPVVLECDARGDPIPQVIWYHGPNQVDSSARLQLIERNQVLLITSVEEGDGGNYTCLATNLVGVTEQNFQLEVMVPPETLGLREVLISEGSGQRVELECQARGHPIPDITWTYRGELLSESDNIIIDNNLLTIQQAGVEVAGEYQCEAVNSVGSAVKRFHVEVTEAPVIAGGREEVVTVVEGENVTLHCLATGHPDPLVSWLKDSIGVRLSERVDVSWGGQSLMLMDARKEDTARYTCLATNIAGNHTKHYDLQVLQSPQLVEGVDEIVAVAGEVVTLRCSFTGYPQPQISWYFEGSPVGLGEGEDRTMLPSSALQLSPTRPTHSGNYTCQADNEAGQNSHNIALTVMTPPTVKVGSARVVVVSGDEVTLRCRGIGTPAPTLRWLKGHQVITEGPEFEVLPDGSLHLPVATIALADTYVCSGRSVVGADHDHTELVVHELPSVQPVSTEVLAVVGQEVKLTCKVTGHPSPTLTWTRPDQGLKPVTPLDPRIQVLDEDLVLSGVKETDGGSYQCTAHNSAGHTSAHLHLTVHSPPTLAEERLETVVVRRGEELQLTCTASGFPLPRVTWLRDGEVLGDSPGRSLTPAGSLIIPVTKAADSGVYTCQVTNPAGRLYREVEVVVQVPPRLTLLPRTAEVTQSERFVLECEAVGVPVPSISWLLNGVEVEGVGVTPGGRGVLVVERAAKRDEGTYTCLAENEAGHRKGVAAIRVKVPPVIRTGPGETTVLELTAVTLTCLAEGDPAPATTWTKGGHFIHSSDRVQLMDNGSLVINASQASDAGEYKCVVSNDAGAAEATAQLVVHTPPVITHPPVTTVVEVGRSVMFDCVAEGSPTPNIQWNVSPGELHARYLKLTNGSLQLIAAQVVDEGQVICQAYNELGEDLAKANLDIRVSGAWGLWGPWSPCSVSCGTGQQQRRRQCDSPAPRHGGSSCPGDVSQPRPCRPDPCPVDGKWSPWQSWSECSTTCGTGVRVRVRVCAAPAPVYGGKECDGDGIVEEECHPKDCPVSGGWGEWGEWSECSRSCGEGLRQRSRLCDSPAPAGGGQECDDDPLQLNPCSNPPCLIDGKWSAWAGWSVCSVSCGGGVRQKRRVCDNPIPSNGGRYCPGSDSLEDYCNLDMCPINGGWSLWSEWGGCTASCGGGQRRRFRTCDSPAPSPDGRACPGPDTHTQACNNHTCPVAGLWGSWSEWSSCSMTCGIGFRVRTRRCDSPAPRSGGDPCLGDHSQTATCEGIGCEELPEVARGTLMGELNGEDLGIVSLAANLSTRSHQRTLNSAFNPIIPKHGTWLVPLLPVLSPGQWTAAYERDGAANGHTLTRGFFRREAHVAFATGETVDVTQVVRGVDSTGALLVDIVVTGDVPYLPPASAITLQPYTEDYVQTGGGSLFASSTRTFGLGHHLLPYAWNHTISYDPELGNMPHLVETLHATNLDSSYSTTRRELQYSAGTNMAPAQYSDICPSGFTLDPTGPYCQDNNECLDLTSRCSHGCINTQGGYSCTCTPGYMLGSDGYTCQDVDECSMIGVCGPREQCQNTPGSYSCSYTCGPGLRTTPSGTSCEDINECEEVPDVCDQTCLNLIGGYRCDCRRGFRLIGQSRCVDIDECSQLMSPCSHSCHNTIGSFRCQCPDGYSLLPNGRCKDINECALYLHDCVEGQDCENTPGSYSCTTHCPPGLKHATNVSCTDIDECAEEVSMCHYTQLCTNTWGSYRCSCSRGFTSPGPGHPCLDINECLASPPPCQHRCHNLRGSYECICPPGQQRLPDGKSCVGLQYVEDPQARLPPSSRRPRPALPGLPTSEFQERLLRKFYVKSSCPAGFEYINGECQDLNECRLPDRCQHHCHNTYGSYMCLCPPGYRVNPNLRTCDDVNECSEQHVECGVDELCFNLRGSYKCVSAPCPAHYQRDATTGSCILDCRRGGTGCPPGVHYAHILAFKTASLPAGIQANQDLVRLMAYDQSGHLVPHTLFTIIENQTGIQFRIRLENGKGIMRTLQPLTAGQEYRMVVEAVSYDQQEHTIRYSTRFIIFLHISEYPY